MATTPKTTSLSDLSKMGIGLGSFFHNAGSALSGAISKGGTGPAESKGTSNSVSTGAGAKVADSLKEAAEAALNSYFTNPATDPGLLKSVTSEQRPAPGKTAFGHFATGSTGVPKGSQPYGGFSQSVFGDRDLGTNYVTGGRGITALSPGNLSPISKSAPQNNSGNLSAGMSFNGAGPLPGMRPLSDGSYIPGAPSLQAFTMDSNAGSTFAKNIMPQTGGMTQIAKASEIPAGIGESYAPVMGNPFRTNPMVAARNARQTLAGLMPVGNAPETILAVEPYNEPTPATQPVMEYGADTAPSQNDGPPQSSAELLNRAKYEYGRAKDGLSSLLGGNFGPMTAWGDPRASELRGPGNYAERMNNPPQDEKAATAPRSPKKPPSQMEPFRWQYPQYYSTWAFQPPKLPWA